MQVFETFPFFSVGKTNEELQLVRHSLSSQAASSLKDLGEDNTQEAHSSTNPGSLRKLAPVFEREKDIARGRQPGR